MSPDTEHLAPENSGARCRHLAHHLNLVSGVSLKRAFKMQFRNAYFRSLVHSSQKLWPKPDSGNFAQCILPCKIGGSQNLMKERYLSKTPFLTFVYLSKCNINLPCFFGNFQKRFLWTSSTSRNIICLKDIWHSISMNKVRPFFLKFLFSIFSTRVIKSN